jgi:hypothetical protein
MFIYIAWIELVRSEGRSSFNLMGVSPTVADSDPSHRRTEGSVALRPNSPSRRKSRRIAVIVTVTIAAVVVAAGFISGIYLFPKGSSPGPDTEAQAAAAAKAILVSAPGGPWGLTYAEGFAFTTASFFDLAAYGGNESCSPTGNVPRGVSEGPYSGEYRSGTAVLWLLLYASAVAGSEFLLVQVLNGSAQQIGEIPHYCYPPIVGEPLGPAIDSSAAVHSVLSTVNGSRFASMFEVSNVSFALQHSGPTGAIWIISFSACNQNFGAPGSPTPAGWTYSYISANNGTVDLPPFSAEPC